LFYILCLFLIIVQSQRQISWKENHRWNEASPKKPT
jgi:hypothetical protein